MFPTPLARRSAAAEAKVPADLWLSESNAKGAGEAAGRQSRWWRGWWSGWGMVWYMALEICEILTRDDITISYDIIMIDYIYTIYIWYVHDNSCYINFISCYHNVLWYIDPFSMKKTRHPVSPVQWGPLCWHGRSPGRAWVEFAKKIHRSLAQGWMRRHQSVGGGHDVKMGSKFLSEKLGISAWNIGNEDHFS
jgi:hypothetical protein